jgi:uncharacterized protein (DUF2249 family)
MSLQTDAPVTVLDVRPLLAQGVEPFDAIMEAVSALPPGGSLELVAPFEPRPLYQVLARHGFAHATTQRGPAEWVVRFRQTGITPLTTVAQVLERYPATAPVLADFGLDCCCGGVKPLEFAAQAHGAELDVLLARLQEAAREG